ncbi:flagellar motor protein MotB, partial [mine drainage metagenome]
MAGSAQKKDEKAPIFVKRSKRRASEHHGGVWKVAYADFVTAMMAFFLVMWIVTAVNKAERAAIFNYFKNPSMQSGQSVRAAPGPYRAGRRQHQPDQPRRRTERISLAQAAGGPSRGGRKRTGSNRYRHPLGQSSLAQARKQVAGADH